MAGGKDPVIAELEQSLINLLCSKQEVEEKVPGGIRRVRGLTFNIDVKNPKNPSFTVQIGMCEAIFNVTNGLKERGNCFGYFRRGIGIGSGGSGLWQYRWKVEWN